MIFAPKNKLLISSIVLPILLLLLFKIFSDIYEPRQTYMLALVSYWILILAPIKSLKKGAFFKKITFDKWTALAFIPVIAVTFVAFIPVIPKLTIPLFTLACVTGIINGVLEECYWRGLYLEHFKEEKLKGFLISCLLFTAWHVPLFLIDGISYQGGAWAMIGGAAGMGILWSLVAVKQNNISVVSLSHVLVNILAFSAHYLDNGY